MGKRSLALSIGDDCFDTGRLGLLQDLLQRGLAVKIRVTGGSMAPLLSSGDCVFMTHVPAGLVKKGDLVFYRDAGGRPVLHRLIGKDIKPDGTMRLQTKGDSLGMADPPFWEGQLLARVTRIERRASGKTINLETARSRLGALYIVIRQQLKTFVREKKMIITGRRMKIQRPHEGV